MTARKTLILYEAYDGATEEAARKIGDVLRSKYRLDVDLVDLKEQKVADLSQYQNIVIGSVVRSGKVLDKALKFLQSDLSGKRVACFVSLSQAGMPASYEKAKIKFIEDTLSKYPNINPVATEAFGAHIQMLGETITDNIDLSRVEAWAEELGKKFTE